MTYTEEDPNMDDCRATRSEIEDYRCARERQMMDKPRVQSAAPAPMQTKPRILLVDDSALNRAILAEILGSDYRILEAENGKECMEKLQAEAGDIALVLLDIIMPEMDGFEVLEAMNCLLYTSDAADEL